MANKIHFQATKQGTAACAIGAFDRNGKAYKNSRRTYAVIPGSYIVGPDEFRGALADDRCAHCAGKFTDLMNERRARSGKPFYSDAFTKTLV